MFRVVPSGHPFNHRRMRLRGIRNLIRQHRPALRSLLEALGRNENVTGETVASLLGAAEALRNMPGALGEHWAAVADEDSLENRARTRRLDRAAFSSTDEAKAELNRARKAAENTLSLLSLLEATVPDIEQPTVHLQLPDDIETLEDLHRVTGKLNIIFQNAPMRLFGEPTSALGGFDRGSLWLEILALKPEFALYFVSISIAAMRLTRMAIQYRSAQKSLSVLDDLKEVQTQVSKAISAKIEKEAREEATTIVNTAEGVEPKDLEEATSATQLGIKELYDLLERNTRLSIEMGSSIKSDHPLLSDLAKENLELRRARRMFREMEAASATERMLPQADDDEPPSVTEILFPEAGDDEPPPAGE